MTLEVPWQFQSARCNAHLPDFLLLRETYQHLQTVNQLHACTAQVIPSKPAHPTQQAEENNHTWRMQSKRTQYKT
jgi:hypothetical protein